MPRERLEYMDWLRVLTTAVVVFFHCCMFFTPVPWHMKNATFSQPLFLTVATLDLWMMPLFFLLAGMAAWMSLGSRSVGRYLQERVLRLLVPFYGVGVFVLLPPQFWFDRMTNAGLQQGFLSFYPTYFKSLILGNTPFFLAFWPGHLWFLHTLFLVSVVALPVILLLRGEAVRAWLERGVATLASRAPARWEHLVVLTPFMLLYCLVEVLLRPRPGQFTWESFGCYLLEFLTGVCLMAVPRLREATARAWWWLLGLALGGTLLYLTAVATEFASPLTGGLPYWKVVLLRVLRGLSVYGWILALLGGGMRYLHGGGTVLRTLASVAMPVYILHQTVLLVVGAFIIPQDWSIAAKFTGIGAISMVLIILLVRYAIWPYRRVRFAFGMK